MTPTITSAQVAVLPLGITKDQLKAAVDGLFTLAEGATGRLFVRLALEVARQAVDAAIDQYIQQQATGG